MKRSNIKLNVYENITKISFLNLTLMKCCITLLLCAHKIPLYSSFYSALFAAHLQTFGSKQKKVNHFFVGKGNLVVSLHA